MQRVLRSALGGCAVAMLGAVVLSACGSASTSSGSANSSLTIAWSEAPDTLNPASTGDRSVGPIDRNLFDTLTWLTPSQQVTPDLATKWTVSDDDKTYTFTLRPGVKFQDGTPFNAAAVVANIEYVAAPSTKSLVALGLLGPCITASAVSEYVVAVHCSKPYGPLLDQLSESYLGIQSPAAIKKYGADVGSHPVGTGPFELGTYVPNQKVVLKRYPAYNWAPPALHENGPAKLATLTFDIVTSPQAAVDGLQSGEFQMVETPPGIDYTRLTKAGLYKGLSVPISGLGIYMPMNVTKWPTSDLAVRQAVMYLVNKPGLIKLAQDGTAPVSNTPVTQGTFSYDSALESMYPYDPQKAYSLLTADGWKRSGGYWEKSGRRLNVSITVFPSGIFPQLAQPLQGYMRQGGINMNIEQLAATAVQSLNLKGDMNMTFAQYVAVDPDALTLIYDPKQFLNNSHYSSPTLTNLLHEAEVSPSTSTRASLYDQAQEIIMKNALELPLEGNTDLFLVSKKVGTVQYSGGGFEDFATTTVG
jgi:peptide/nickel transport system substrate-binding protein